MPEGIGIAHVRRSEAQPYLDACAFRRLEGETSRLLANMVQEYSLARTRCINVLEREAYTLLLVEAPEVEAAELRPALRWCIKDLIDFDVDDAIVDAFEIPGQSLRGQPRMLYVVVAHAALLGKRVELLQDAGLTIEAIDIPEMALRNIAALLPQDIDGLAMLQIGCGGSMITLTRQSTLYLSRWIDVKVEQLQHAASLPNYADFDEVIPAWHKIMDTLMLEVQRSLDFYESHSGQPPLTGLVIALLEQDIPGLCDYFSERLGLPVSFLDVNQILAVEAGVRVDAQASCLVAIGGALRTAANP